MGHLDIKYHIVSIISIFLALGLGIIIGINILGTNELIESQNAVIDRLEKNLVYLNKEKNKKSEALRKAKDKLRNYEKVILPLFIKDMFEGQKIGVINFSTPYFPMENLKLIMDKTKIEVVFTINLDFNSVEKPGVLNDQYFKKVVDNLFEILIEKTNSTVSELKVVGEIKGDENYLIFNTENSFNEIEKVILPLFRLFPERNQKLIIFTTRDLRKLKSEFVSVNPVHIFNYSKDNLNGYQFISFLLSLK